MHDRPAKCCIGRSEVYFVKWVLWLKHEILWLKLATAYQLAKPHDIFAENACNSCKKDFQKKNASKSHLKSHMELDTNALM
jgi:hypothetical protein